VEKAVVSAGAIAVSGYLLSAVASLFLPRRELVVKHAEEQAKAQV
jgi:hypothetical protein